MIIGWRTEIEPADRSLADEDHYDLFEINMSFHGLMYTYSKMVPNKHLALRTQQMHLDESGEWAAWNQEKDGGGKIISSADVLGEKTFHIQQLFNPSEDPVSCH